MNTTFTRLALVLGVVALMAAPASAIIFDGSGDPNHSGLEAINTPDDWQFDTPSEGFLYQPPTENDGGYGVDDRDNLTKPDLAATELDASKGYFVEWRVDLISSSDGAGWPGFNIGNVSYLEDSSTRTLYMSGIDPNTATSELYGIRDYWDEAPVATVDMSGGFHTIRLEHPGGNAETIDVFFDGIQVLDDHVMTPTGDGFARFFTGNSGANSVGEAVYDYIVINQEIGGVQPPPPTDFTWNKEGAGDWNERINWDPGKVPGDGSGIQNSHETATFGDKISSASTVYTDLQRTLNSIQFDNNAASYIIAGAGGVNLVITTDAAAVAPSIGVASGDHQFQAIVMLHNDATVDVSSDSSLEFNNRLNLNGFTLTKTGDGDLAISNDVVLSGGELLVQQGTVTGNGTVGGDLINNGGTVSPGDSASVNSAIPEPSTMLMLVLGGLLVARAWRW